MTGRLVRLADGPLIPAEPLGRRLYADDDSQPDGFVPWDSGQAA